MTKELPIITIDDCFSYTAVARKLGLPRKGKSIEIAKEYVIQQKLDTTHFTRKILIKHSILTKECPVCKKTFTTKTDSKEKVTCSKACSNTHFRSGINNPNFKEGSNYRTMCFLYHKKECIICKENKIVEVHHYDENHENNDPTNLVPICPTHHQYIHSRYKEEVQSEVDNYINTFKENWSVR